MVGDFTAQLYGDFLNMWLFMVRFHQHQKPVKVPLGLLDEGTRNLRHHAHTLVSCNVQKAVSSETRTNSGSTGGLSRVLRN